MNGLRHSLAAIKVPYMVTIFLAIAGWAVIYVVEASVSGPIVSYERKDENKQITITVENLSRNARIKSVVFGLADPTEALRFLEEDAKPIPPAPPAEAELTMQKDGVKYSINHFHPGSKYTLHAKYRGEGEPVFQLLSSDEAVYLVEEPSLRTFFVRHEISSLLLIVIFGLVMSGVSLYVQFSSSANPQAEGTAVSIDGPEAM